MMESEKHDEVGSQVRSNLVELGGRTAQELGFSRIAGQLLVYLYLTEGDCPLEQIEEDLGLSKASVSISARQLESMGLLKRSWRPGDRRSFYRTADNLADVFRAGMVSVVRRKLEQAGGELDQALAILSEEAGKSADGHFLLHRVKRAKSLRDRADRILNSRILKYLAK